MTKPSTPLDPHRFSWSRNTAATRAEDWFETLAHLGPMRVLLTQNAGSTRARVQAHGLLEEEAKALQAEHGGTVREASWLTALHPPQRAPIKVRDRFLVVSTQAERETALEQGKPALWIPASMAFGTGEHATTAMCLRHLADIASEYRGTPWTLLDLGTGSAILAMAGQLLGASDILGTDFDPLALKTARENLRNNQMRGIKLQRADVLEWQPPHSWSVVAANLFSGVLIQAAPRIAKSVAPGGHLLLSGVLREQEQEVLRAFNALDFHIEKIGRKGKWISVRLRRAPASSVTRSKQR